MPAKQEPDLLKLARHRLGSIDLSDVEHRKSLSTSERRAYCGAIHAVLPRLEKDIEQLLYHQLLFIAKECATWEQAVYGRGVMEGMSMLLEQWRSAGQEFVDNATPEEFDKFNPIPEV